MDRQKYWWLMPLSIIVSALILVAGLAHPSRAFHAVNILTVMALIPVVWFLGVFLLKQARRFAEIRKAKLEHRLEANRKLAEVSGKVPSHFS